MMQSQTSMTAPIGDFFTIQDDFPVNLVPLDNADQLPNDDEFEAQIPELFLIASSMAESDTHKIQAIKVEQPAGSALVDFLEQQHKRLNILLGYMLRNEDDAAHRFSGKEYGGGGIRVVSDAQLEVGQIFQAKLFFKQEALAIYCYTRLESSEPLDNSDQFLCTLCFERIREEDQELLIRASLHAQSRQLKERSKQRREQKSNAEEKADDSSNS
ncbi:PilZ domain-containing protein [Idiomarina sp. X4]|uniref:PilZ domain-containing protein n=1 Tax=Idiomarina sp. X4 TaxID=2055892 RepID=UPI000C28B287|nr:PilZ domain-containing protein [Idiomarina sp. X4]ATZ74123.1 PilZ domain-containing protein [Idiomarina sp. X4]